MTTTNEQHLRDLLSRFVQEVSSWNADDCLDGYLNCVGVEFNDELAELGLPTLQLTCVAEAVEGCPSGETCPCPACNA